MNEIAHKKKITILRSAVGSLPSISLIKDLKKKGVRVIGLDSNPLSVGFHFCDKSYVVPYGNSPRFLKKILEICKMEKPEMILSGPEEEILTLTKNRKLFSQQNITVLSPEYKIAKICADKMKTYEKLLECNIPVARIFKKNVKFPCIIKPRNGRGGENVYKINNHEELKFYKKKIKKSIVTEFLKGEEYSVDVLGDTNGNPISIIPRKRIHTESGISVKGITVYDKEIIDYCKDITKKLKLIGPSCIQCFKYRKKIKFIEINNRFGGGSSLSLQSDPTIITNIIKMARGEEPIESKGFHEGLTMLRFYDEVFTEKQNLDYFKESK